MFSSIENQIQFIKLNMSSNKFNQMDVLDWVNSFTILIMIDVLHYYYSGP